MKIYLVRHGKTDWNVENRIMGSNDIPLNETGIQEITKAAHFLKGKGIKKIFSSPVNRCVESAQIIANTLRCDIETDNGLRETEFGDWVGKIYDDLKKEVDFRAYYEFPYDKVIPNGESFSEFYDRVIDSFIKISEENTQDLIIATHADPIKTIILHTLKCPLTSAHLFKIDNASVSLIEIKKHSKIIYVNLLP